MDYSEKWGKSIDAAVELALKDLKVSIDEVNVIVLEEPSKGFLGLGSKLAKVRVELKSAVIEEPNPVKEEEVFDYGVKDLRSKPKAEAAPKKKYANNKKKSKPRKKESFDIPEEVASVISNKPEDLAPVTEHVAIDFLKETTAKMGLDLTITAEGNAENLYINLDGKDAGTVIGKRGQTLDSIQYLTSLVVNKEHGKYVRVVVDAESYRAKREKTLQQLALRLAAKVGKTGKPFRLEPMNPYERMVIHATLHTDQRVTTKSEGEEPYRRVIIVKN